MIKQTLDILLSYVPPAQRKYVPLAGLVAILLLMLLGQRYLPPETVAVLSLIHI